MRLRHWCQNQYQVTNQVTIEGSYKNRYDVTLLINGLPLVQIELKRRGIELKEAFNQIKRYQKHSFHAAKLLWAKAGNARPNDSVERKHFRSGSPSNKHE